MSDNDMMVCPRCLGKGYVDKIDIARLGMEHNWSPGACRYCSGNGQVPRGYVNVRDVRERLPVGCFVILLAVLASVVLFKL